MENKQPLANNLSLEKAQTFSLVVWCAITATMIFLMCASLLMANGEPVTQTPERDAFLATFPVIGAVTVLCSAVVYRFIRSRARRSTPGTVTAASTDADNQRYLGFFGAMVASCALHEAVAVEGFILTLITKNISDMVPYFVAALTANIAIFPKKKRIENF